MTDDAETETDRSEPPFRGGERDTLLGFLRWQRETLERKCAGLDAFESASMGRSVNELASGAPIGTSTVACVELSPAEDHADAGRRPVGGRP